MRSRFGSLRSLLHGLSCLARFGLLFRLASAQLLASLPSTPPPCRSRPSTFGPSTPSIQPDPLHFYPANWIPRLLYTFQYFKASSCHVQFLLFAFVLNNSCFITPLFRVRVVLVPRSHLSVLILVTRLLPRYLPSSLILQQNNFSRGVPLTAELRALSRSSRTMATKLDTATVTGADLQNDAPIKRSGGSHVSLNSFKAPQPLAPIRTHMKKKYRHVAAVHSKPRTSCLSHDSQVSPSFLGFRNLMVIVLGMSKKPATLGVASNSSISCRELALDD